MVHVAAQRTVVVEFHAEFNGCDDGWRGHGAEAVVRHAHDVDHHGDPAARPDVGRCPAAGDIDQRVLDGACQQHRVFRDPGTQAAAGAAQEKHGGQRRFAVFADALDNAAHVFGHVLLHRLEFVVENIPARVLAGG